MASGTKNTQNLSKKVLLFSQTNDPAYVKLTPTQKNFTAVTVCHRTKTDIKRDHALFSLNVRCEDNSFVVSWNASKQALSAYVHNTVAEFPVADYGLNKWHSICTTWDSETGMVDMWLNGEPLIKKYVSKGPLSGKPIITLGQEQKGYGCNFDANQSFLGMMTDVHMWDKVLCDCEIQKYMNDQRFPAGNVVNWEELEPEIIGELKIENKRNACTRCESC